MARKRYQISFEIDSTRAEAAARRVVGELAKAEQAAARMAKGGSSAFNASARASVAASNATAAAQQKVAVGLNQLQMSAVKFGDAQRAAAAKAAKAQQDAAAKSARAHEAGVARGMVGIDQLRMSGLKLQDDMVRAAQKKASAEDRLRAKSLSDEQVSLAVRNRMVQHANQKRIDAGLVAAGIEKRTFGDAIAGAMGFGEAVTGVGAAMLGLRAGKALVSAVTSSFVDAHKAAEGLARLTLDTVGALRDIAAIKEKFAPDDADVEQHMRVRVAGGMDAAMAHSFQNELYNTLGTVTKAKFSDKERQELEIRGARFVGRTSAGAAEAKNRATILGLMPDYLPGKPTAREVVSKAERIDTILGKGAGSQEVSTGQYQELLTSLTNENLHGFFKDPEQAAALNAIASKFGAGHSADSVLQAVRGLRSFTKMRKGQGVKSSQGETLKAMGLTEFDDPAQAMLKMFKYADKEFQGEAFDVALARRGFRNTEENKRLAQFYGEYQKGNFQSIMGMAGAPIDPGLAERKDEAFAASDTGRDRIERQRIERSKVIEGRRARELLLQKQAAEAKLIEERALDVTPEAQMRARLAAATTGGLREGRDILIEERALAEARKRAGLAQEPPIPSPVAGAMGANLGNPLAAAGLFFGGMGLRRIFQDPAEEINRLKELETTRGAIPDVELVPKIKAEPGAIGPQAMALPPMGWRTALAATAMGGFEGGAVGTPAIPPELIQQLIGAIRENTEITRRNSEASRSVAKPIAQKAPGPIGPRP